MIPTKYRTKIPQSLSYPIGTELLTEALADVPQLEHLTVSFFHMIRAHKKLHPFPVIEVRYRNFNITLGTPEEFIARGMYDETWELTVRAVPREQKFVVKQLLLAEGLPKLAAWLQAKRSPAWLHGRKDFTIWFSADTQQLSYSEDGFP